MNGEVLDAGEIEGSVSNPIRMLGCSNCLFGGCVEQGFRTWYQKPGLWVISTRDQLPYITYKVKFLLGFMALQPGLMPCMGKIRPIIRELVIFEAPGHIQREDPTKAS